MALCAFDKAIDHASEREQFGRPIGEFQGMRWKIAEMAARLETSRTMTYRAALDGEHGGRIPDRLATSVAKYVSGRTAEFVVSEALQVHGAAGYQRDHPLEYLYRLQRGRRIAAGTDEMLRNRIADVVFEEGLSEVA